MPDKYIEPIFIYCLISVFDHYNGSTELNNWLNTFFNTVITVISLEYNRISASINRYMKHFFINEQSKKIKNALSLKCIFNNR